MATIARYGAANNVMVNLENDDLVSEDAFFLAKVIDQVNSPWLRALPDFCNSMLSGKEEFNYDAMDAMFRRAYKYFSMEFEGTGDPYDGTRKLIEESLRPLATPSHASLPAPRDLLA